MIHRLICALHLSAALLLCASPVLSSLGRDYFDIEFHVSDSDDSGKDVEDESEEKDLIAHFLERTNFLLLLTEKYQVRQAPGLPAEEHMDVFTPPPEA